MKIFLEISLNQIDYFKEFNKDAKNEWIFNMKKKTFEKGSLLCQKESRSTEMYVIQSGQVEIVSTMDKGQEFVIERLYR